MLGEDLAVHFGEGVAAGDGGGDVQHPVAAHQLRLSQAGAVLAGLVLVFALGQMELEAHAVFGGVGGQTLPQGIVGGVLGPDAGIDLDAAVVVVVPLFGNTAELCALLVGLEIKLLLLGDEPIGGQSQIALHTGLGNDLSGGIGVVIQIGHGGDAEPQALGNTQRCGGLGAAGIHLCLLLELELQCLRQGQLVGEAAHQAGGQMGVAVHQTGHQDHAGAVDDLGGLNFGSLPADGGDFAFGNAHMAAENHIQTLIHGHNGYVGNQSIQKISRFLSLKRKVLPFDGRHHRSFRCTARGIWDCGTASGFRRRS